MQGSSNGANIVVGAQGSNGVVSNGLTGDIQDIFTQFTEFLFNGGTAKDIINILPLSAAGITNHTVFLNGNDGDDTLDGRTADTSIVASGGTGNDQLTGGAQNDTLAGNAGRDRLDGREGSDTASYSDAAKGVRVDLNDTTYQSVGGGLGRDKLISIESLTGSRSADTLIGNSGDNTLAGGAGKDTLVLSNGGNDVAMGGDGNDLIQFGAALAAADRADGGAGTDTVVLSGNYSTNLKLAASTIENVEIVDFIVGNTYRLTSVDQNVAAGQVLTVNGSALGAGDSLGFNGARESDGRFTMFDGAGNDAFAGEAGNDTFVMTSGGMDHVSGGAGNDLIYFGATFTSADHVDGGDGRDTLSLDGDYAGGVIFGRATIANVERIYLSADHGYKLTTDDANVAQGDTLVVNGSQLGSGDDLTFNGAKETDGQFEIFGGAGANRLTGGLLGDTFVMALNGADTISGGGGNDRTYYGANFVNTDRIDGGAGTDTLSFDGDYSSGLMFAFHTLTSVEKVLLGNGHDYKLIMNDGNVAAGRTLSIDASELGGANGLVFDGSRETDGHYRIEGGLGADTFSGGALADVFAYQSASESTSNLHDTITDFDFSLDRIDTQVTVSAINHAVVAGRLSAGVNFDTELSTAISAKHLGSHHAVLFTASIGSLHGQSFLVVDLNGTAGYQTGEDLVIRMHDASGTLTTSDFI